jgi:hypothetical protein
MVITNYQVQSVLRTYTRELQRSKLSADADLMAGSGASSVEKVYISSEGQRKYMMDRMTSQVLEKMHPKQDNDVRPAKNQSTVGNGPVTEGNE